MSKQRTPTLSWEINGQFVTAWVSDHEVFSICPVDWSVYGQGFELRSNSVATAQPVYLGRFPYLDEAQQAAAGLLRDDRG